MIVCLVLTTFVLSSCDKENIVSDEPGYEDIPSVPSNPMVGKTIRCNDKYEGFFTNIFMKGSIQFISATKYIEELRQTVDELDSTGKWNRTFDFDETMEGSYTYSSSKIVLTSNDGVVLTLTKVPDGWKHRGYVYK